jgi:hypothetical protein
MNTPFFYQSQLAMQAIRYLARQTSGHFLGLTGNSGYFGCPGTSYEGVLGKQRVKKNGLMGYTNGHGIFKTYLLKDVFWM